MQAERILALSGQAQSLSACADQIDREGRWAIKRGRKKPRPPKGTQQRNASATPMLWEQVNLCGRFELDMATDRRTRVTRNSGWFHDCWQRAVSRERVPQIAKRVPKRKPPNWLVRLSAIVDPVVRDRLFELGLLRPVSADKARAELGWNPRSNDDAIIATAESLLAEGVIRA